MLLEVVEEPAHLRGLHAALVVVEHDVVRLVVRPRSTRCSACAGRGSCAGPAGTIAKSFVLARLDPDRGRERGRARHLRAQLRRHLARLLPVARRDPDQARLERVVLLLLAPAASSSSSLPDLGRGELLVGDPADRRELLGPDRGPGGRHHHLLVPAEERRGLAEIGDLGQLRPQLLELAGSRSETYTSATQMRLANALERPSRRDPPRSGDTAQPWRRIQTPSGVLGPSVARPRGSSSSPASRPACRSACASIQARAFAQLND